MKQKISVTIEKDILASLDSFVDEGIFRNKSHALEFAMMKFLNEKKQ